MAGEGEPEHVGGTHAWSVAPNTRYTSLLPPLSPDAYAALREDIRARGVLVAVEYTVDGVLLDGAHRVRAAGELGVPYPRVIRSGLATDAERVAHVLALHAHRRHLTPGARLELITRLRADGLSVRAIAAVTGVPKSTVAAQLPPVQDGTPLTGTDGDGKTLGLDGKRYPRRRPAPAGPSGITVGSAHEQARASAALATLSSGAPSGRNLTLHRAERLAREARLVSARTTTNTVPLPATVDLRLGDFREVLTSVPDGSIDLILTDPPWTMDALRSGVWGDLASMAARTLKPGGHLAVYTGTQHLPEVLAELHGVDGLEYRWAMAVTNGAGTAGARLPRVSSRWKPVVLYRKAGAEKADWLATDLVGGDGAQEKDLHRWQQGVSEAVDLISALTVHGAVVADMFCGSGTTGVAAHLARRSFIGSEIDPDTYATARSRLARLDG